MVFFWVLAPVAAAAAVIGNRWLRLTIDDLVFLIVLIVLAIMFIGLGITPDGQPS